MFFSSDSDACYALPFKAGDDCMTMRNCTPVGTGIAYGSGFDSRSFSSQTIGDLPVSGERLDEFFSRLSQRAFADPAFGVFFFRREGVLYAMPLSNVFSKAPPPFSLCAANAVDCGQLDYASIYGDVRAKGFSCAQGEVLVPVRPTSFFPAVFTRSGGKYYANYDVFGFESGAFLREFLREEIIVPADWADKGVTVNGERALSPLNDQ